VKSNEVEVLKVRRFQLQASVRLVTDDRFAEDENAVIDYNLRLAQSSTIVGVYVCLFKAFV
jgi:hypothetical protein